ncbi:MAG TPA: class I SAM-dependent methyltransferase [Patescibacteria group bacterium]|nr:class I SAM-dependent methyltransferase [Patescibacteria group bacterium]
MKNILNEKPSEKLTGRLEFSTKFVDNKDIQGKKVLDIGCGFGWFELSTLKKGVKEIAGVEISALDLKPAKENIKDKRAIFKIGGALKIPFKDNYFDAVVAWEVIEHIPKDTENKMFKEVKRVLKKNGIFYLSTPYDSLRSKYLDPAYWLIGHRHYSREKLIKLGKGNNFKIREIQIKGRIWSLISLLDLYIAKWIFRRQPFFEEEISRKVDEEYRMDENSFMGIFVKYEKK